MASRMSNDNSDAIHGLDAHGQAAILLVESLLHGLIARGVISVADAVEIVDTAAEVKGDVSAELGDSPANLRRSLGILAAISQSLRHDLAER
ncbi:MAG: hypothetical protein ACK4I0_09560 [Brevundimonas sp.]|uniref:hypothetical protein n=1 Tax=Brevundimonas sp. TaxID=1871086 RepID=UPI00391CE3EA